MGVRDDIAAICHDLPGAEVSDPCRGGQDARNVGGGMSACTGAATPGVPVATPDGGTTTLLIDAGADCTAPGWDRSGIRMPEEGAADVLRHRIPVSHDIVRADPTGTARSALAHREVA